MLTKLLRRIKPRRLVADAGLQDCRETLTKRTWRVLELRNVHQLTLRSMSAHSLLLRIGFGQCETEPCKRLTFLKVYSTLCIVQKLSIHCSKDITRPSIIWQFLIDLGSDELHCEMHSKFRLV